MGHKTARDIYGKVARKMDSLHVRVPYNRHLHPLLKELFPEEEAALFARMPYTFSDAVRISRIVKLDEAVVERVLEEMCRRGTVIDITVRGKQYYMPCPMVIGTFEWVMMKNDGRANTRDLARLFHSYFEGGDLIRANTSHGLDMSTSRVLSHGETIDESQQTLILDYEKAEEIIRSSDRISQGLCACRHEKDHLGDRECDTPTDTCLNLGWTADYLIRRDIAREISTSEALENVARSRELGLVMSADNVKKNAMFICQCCGCCCHLLLGVSRHGCPNTIVTSNYLATVDDSECIGCGECARACPIDAVEMTAFVNTSGRKRKRAAIDDDLCLGCGVCALKCKSKSLVLKERGKRMLYPETTFERIILQCIGTGTLQNQIFDNPESLTQEFMRGFVGAFLRLPTKSKTVMGAALNSRFFRSSFLKVSTAGMKLKGKGWVTKI